MNIVELLHMVGADALKFQSLDTSATNLNYSAKKGTTITFRTDAALTPQGTELAGLVVWVPRDLLGRALAGANGYCCIAEGAKA